jgi:hypothetical protein
MPARNKSASKRSPKRTTRSNATKRSPTVYAKFVKDYWSRNGASLKLLPFAEASRKVVREYYRTVKGMSPPPPGLQKRPKKNKSGGKPKKSQNKKSKGGSKKAKRTPGVRSK